MEKEVKIAEFVGIMLGDGSIGVYNTKAESKIKKHRVVKVTLDSRNKQYIEYVAKLMKEVLGEHAYNKYFEAKMDEWKEFQKSVTDWELDRYKNL